MHLLCIKMTDGMKMIIEVLIEKLFMFPQWKCIFSVTNCTFIHSNAIMHNFHVINILENVCFYS